MRERAFEKFAILEFIADGGFEGGRRLRAFARGAALGRQALHARLLGFVHPVTGERLRFEREPPPDFADALAALRAAG